MTSGVGKAGRTWAGLLGAACALGLGVGGAAAAQFRVRSETLGDAYQRVTSGDAVVNRRRLHQLLGFEAHDLLGDGGYRLSVATLLRFDADFGLSEDDLGQAPGLRREQLSLQYAWVDARDLAGVVDVRLGRQLVIDALDFVLLDGGVVTVRGPLHLGLELQAGVEAPEGADFTASSFALDGVRLMRDDAEAAEATRTTWVLGAGLVTHGLRDVRARIGYRRLFSAGEVDAEKVGGSVAARLGARVDANALASYDLFNGRFDRLQAGVRWRPSDAFDVEGEYVRLLPTFDADSIFNIFTAFALNDANVRLRFHPSSADRIVVGAMARFFGNEAYPEGASSAPIDTVVAAWGAMAGYARELGARGRVRVDLSWEGGYGGDRLLGDVGGSWVVVPREWELDGRLTAVSFADALQPHLEAVSVGYQLGARYVVDTRAGVSLLVEQNFSRLAWQNLRVLAVVDLDVWL